MNDPKKAQQIYKKSVDVLKEVQLDNGGCLATPEGERYPYVYPRDHSLILLGFQSAGLNERVKNGLQFVLETRSEDGAFPQRLDMKGKDASYKPIQIDGTGLILFVFSTYVSETGDFAFAQKYFPRVQEAVRYIINNSYENIEGVYEQKKHNLVMPLIYTPNSLHEYPPTEQGLEIWANCICCAALQNIYELSTQIDAVDMQCKEYAEKVKKGILKFMWNAQRNTFVKTIRVRESSSVLVDPDVGKYAVAEFGVLPDEDNRVRATVADVEQHLWHPELGGMCRYPKYEGRNNGGWGPWPNYTLMICRHYIRRGNQEKADEYMNWVVDTAYNNLLPEHIATKKEFDEYVADFTQAGILREDRKRMVANAQKHPMFKKNLAYITVPLAWSHAEYIRTYNLYNEVFD